MKRTRKWAFVAQEAARLAALKLKPADIAAQLGVNKSTVTRWIAKGKLPRIVVSNQEPAKPVTPRLSPAEWARSMREAYSLDATDEALVTLGESALSLTRDITVSAAVQLSAAGRFQAIVRQLALLTHREVDEPVAAPVIDTAAAPQRRLPRRPTGDPRKGLMAVK